MSEKYTTGMGQKLTVHNKEDCKGSCPIHNPSIDWPTNWRDDWGFMEAICPHGVGYPHPDDQSEEALNHAFGTCGSVKCLNNWRNAKMISAGLEGE